MGIATTRITLKKARKPSLRATIATALPQQCLCGAIMDISTIEFWGNKCPSCFRDMSPEVLILRAELAAKEHARKAAETRWAREKAQSHWRGKRRRRAWSRSPRPGAARLPARRRRYAGEKKKGIANDGRDQTRAS